MKKYILAITLGLLSISPSFARIGENIDECKSRYGMWASFHPINDKRVKVVFNTKLMDVEVIFYEGICECISYIRHEGVHNPYYFSDEECDVLKNVNSKGKEWVKDKDIFVSPMGQWHTIDKTYYASRICAQKGSLFREGEPVNDTTFCELSIETADAVKHAQQERKNDVDKEMKVKADKANELLEGY
jgi:hypothetical protein